MAEWNVINSAELVENWRFDSEYWREVYIENLEAVRRSRQGGFETSLLRKVVKKVTGSAFYPSFVGYYSDDGMPFLRVADLGDLFLKQENLVKISPSVIQAHHQVSTISTGDLVIAKGGSIGGVCIVTDDFGESAVCPDVIAVQTDFELLDPYYLSVFLNTKFGQLQLERNKSQQVQAHLTFPAVERLEIAYPSQETQMEIREVAMLAYTTANDSKSFYAKAKHLLESELGLDKLSFRKPVGYTARFSELEQSRRLDPEHFYPAFHNLVAHLPDHIDLVPLGTQLSFCQRGKQPVYSKHGRPVVNSKHVQSNKVILEGNRTAISNPIAELQIRHGDTLMNGTGRGTIGRVAPYLIDEHAIPDNHVTILRSPTLDPTYLSFYLNSKAGQLQVEMHQRGTSGQLELYPFDIRKFFIWSAPEALQKEIRSLYEQAAASEQQSKELLNQAKTRVEQLIEEAVRS